MTIGKNIARMRREKGWTQAELGELLGVSNQAVSKWESEINLPDVMALPALADAFQCSIDALFSREWQSEITHEIHYDHCAQFPWPDDGILRGVVCEGKKILQRDALNGRFTFEITGDAKSVQSECSISVTGNVSQGCTAGADIAVGGSVSGGCHGGADIIVGGTLSGGGTAGGDITVGGSLSGGVCTGGDVVCGNLSGDVTCGGDLTVSGDVEAHSIKGNVVCHAVTCDKIEGDVIIAPGKNA